MASNASLFEIHSTGCHLALSTQRRNSVLLPSVPRRARPRPPSLDTAPAYWPFLGTKPRPAINASPVAIRIVAAVDRFEYFRWHLAAIWTTHRHHTSSPGCCLCIRTGRAAPIQVLGLREIG